MAKRYAAIALVLGVILVPGCVTFEQETIAYQHDSTTDRLYAYITYSGIFGTHASDPDRLGPADSLSASEEADLLASWSGERIFFFSNAFAVLNLAALREQQVPGNDADVTAAERANRAATRQLESLLVANMRVSNGPFFIDRTGRLSAVQRVTVTNVTAVLSAVNVVARQQWLAEAEDRDDDARRRIVALGLRFAAIDGNRVTLRFPQASEEPGEDAKSFIRAGGTYSFADQIVTVTFGQVDSPRAALTMPVAKSAYVPDALRFVREQIGVAEKFDPAADADLFFPRAVR